MKRVTVAIVSTVPERLIETLGSIAMLRPPEKMTLDVLIADASANGNATSLLAAHPFKNLEMTCLQVESGSVSIARNTLLNACQRDWLIFVDDCETVPPDWLQKLFACQKQFQADVVLGAVCPVYPDTTPTWIKAANPLFENWGPRGKRLYRGHARNTLLDMKFIRALGLRFENPPGLSNGDDVVFFGHAAERGARIFATDDAAVQEHIPEQTFSIAYILDRTNSSGQAYGIMRLSRHPDPLWHAVFALSALAKCAAAAPMAIALHLLHRGWSLRLRQVFARNKGKLQAVFTRPPQTG